MSFVVSEFIHIFFRVFFRCLKCYCIVNKILQSFELFVFKIQCEQLESKTSQFCIVLA